MIAAKCKCGKSVSGICVAECDYFITHLKNSQMAGKSIQEAAEAKRKELISSIRPNAANFDYCKDNHKINGTLHIDIDRAMKDYAKWQAEQSAWISVEDKLPDDSEIVICYGNGTKFSIAKYDAKKQAFFRYVDVLPGEIIFVVEYHKITHWQRLPKAPTLPNS